LPNNFFFDGPPVARDEDSSFFFFSEMEITALLPDDFIHPLQRTAFQPVDIRQAPFGIVKSINKYAT
jgi:hypothetical protein